MRSPSHLNAECIIKQLLQAHEEQVLSTWAASLVERQSQLKFQHLLTEFLFNNGASNMLYDNMPFEIDPAGDLYKINLRDFEQRRLPLISSQSMISSRTWSSYVFADRVNSFSRKHGSRLCYPAGLEGIVHFHDNKLDECHERELPRKLTTASV